MKMEELAMVLKSWRYCNSSLHNDKFNMDNHI